jgi:hypothetical protein
MIPGRQWRSVGKALNVVAGSTTVRAEIDVSSDDVVLIVAAEDQRLTIREIEIEPGDRCSIPSAFALEAKA